MKIQDLFENWGIKDLKLSVGFLEMNWEPQPDEQQAAWELYIELLTRISTQPLPDVDGDEATALASIFGLFEVTRKLLKERGRKAQTFSKVTIVVLNQKIRPFTAKWHTLSLDDGFKDQATCEKFRVELKEIQEVLSGYAGVLAQIANVEDFQNYEQGPLERL